jgi:hypothetical protein
MYIQTKRCVLFFLIDQIFFSERNAQDLYWTNISEVRSRRIYFLNFIFKASPNFKLDYNINNVFYVLISRLNKLFSHYKLNTDLD